MKLLFKSMSKPTESNCPFSCILFRMQEEFVEEDELGRLDCGHGYHSVCIKQWLVQKNECPICKSSAYMKP